MSNVENQLIKYKKKLKYKDDKIVSVNSMLIYEKYNKYKLVSLAKHYNRERCKTKEN